VQRRMRKHNNGEIVGMLATLEGDDIFCFWRCYPSMHGKIITWFSHNNMSKMGTKGTFLFFHYKSLFFLNVNYPPTWSIYFFLQLSRDRCYIQVSLDCPYYMPSLVTNAPMSFLSYCIIWTTTTLYPRNEYMWKYVA